MGIKERRAKILLAFCLLGGTKLKPVEVDDQFLKVFDLTLNQKTKSTLNSLVKKGALSQSPDNKRVYTLTNVGFSELSHNFPYFRFFREPWDGVWRVLSYEIPEKKRELRDKLRREVAGWGLGPWHRSFWLTPHPIIKDLKSLVSGKEEQEYVQAFESKHVFGDRDILVEKVWRKIALHGLYKELFKTWHETLSKDEDKLVKFSMIVSSYVNVIRKDPGLPKEIMGSDWIGYEALDLFNEIKEILLSRA